MHNLAQYADWAYLIGAVLFILTLRGLSSPATAIMGNRYGMMGMGLAVFATFFVAPNPNVAMIIGAMILGAGIGIFRARTVPMTQMPETVAMMHSLVGLAAVLIAIAAVLHAGQHTIRYIALNYLLAVLSVRLLSVPPFLLTVN